MAAAAALLLAGCEITRVYVGTPLVIDPATVITIGETTAAEVLQVFGAPDLLERRTKGDVFTYRYIRRNERTITIEEPVITNTELYTYTEVMEDSERLVVLFDRDGVVSGYGFRTGLAGLDRSVLPSISRD